MSEQIRMTRGQLAELAVKKAQLHAHCGGLRSITVRQLRDGQIPGVNWDIDGPINFGDADPASCDVALSKEGGNLLGRERIFHEKQFELLGILGELHGLIWRDPFMHVMQQADFVA